jgi:hypothetical protein
MIIMSAYRAELTTKQNEARHTRLRVDIRSIGGEMVDATGYYKGIQEGSLVVTGLGPESLQVVARKYNQESILVVGANSDASLLFDDGSTYELGKFRQVSESDVEGKDAYTIVEGRFYIAE